jgi:cytoskeletal protein CcmA (bactofilin family)
MGFIDEKSPVEMIQMFSKQVYSFNPWRKEMTLTIKKIDKISTFIGQDTEFEGKLKFYGEIRIDGHFKGEISGEGTLIVGEGATIDSDIHVSQILNSGEIQGNVITDKGIEVTESGKVLGDIHSPSMVVSEGAVIDGNCRMLETEKENEKKLAVVTLDKSEKNLLPESSPEECSDANSRG